MATSEACWRWRRRDHKKASETPLKSIIEVVEVIGGRGEPAVEEDEVGDGWGKAEQKGRIKRDMNSWRAMLSASALGVW